MLHQFPAQILITMLNSYANVVIHILDFHSSIFNIIADLSFLASVTEKVNISRSNTNPEEEVSAAHHHTSLMSLKSLSVLITLHSESNVLQEWHMISKLGYKKHDSFICWKKKETDARLSVPLYQQFTAILLVWGGPKRLNVFETSLWSHWAVNLSFTSSQ